MGKPFLTISEVSEKYGFSHYRLAACEQSGDLCPIRFGEHGWRYWDERQIRAFLKKSQANGDAAPLDKRKQAIV